MVIFNAILRQQLCYLLMFVCVILLDLVFTLFISVRYRPMFAQAFVWLINVKCC